jgi:chromosomal replication initiation ATPase DnaA
MDPEAVAALCRQLNADQRHAFAIVPAVLDTSPDRHFFLQGAEGTGKTFLYRALYGHLRAAGKSILYVASSGIAATLLPAVEPRSSRSPSPSTS